MTVIAVLSRLDAAGFALLRLLITVLWQSTILLAACGGLAFLLRHRKESVRHALWVAALLLLPLLPVLSWTVSSIGAPRREFPVLPVYAPVSDRVDTPVIRPMSGVARPPSLPAGGTPKAPHRFYPWAAALAVYAGVVLFLLAAILAGRLRVRRWILRGDAVMDDRILAIFDRARERLGLRREVTVLESDTATVPFAFHTFRPVVLLPKGFAARLADPELASVAAHELAHIRRHDPLTLTLVSLVRAVFFFQPLVWLAAREAGYLAECACDSAALELTGESRAYAGLISRLAEELPHRTLTPEYAAGLVFSRSVFLKRVETILSDKRKSMKRFTGLALAGTLAAAVISLAVVLIIKPGEMKTTQGRKPVPSAASALASGPETNTGDDLRATVSGMVKGYDGKPVGNASVFLLLRPSGIFQRGSLNIMRPTAKNGSFSFRYSAERLRDPLIMKELIVYSPDYAISFLGLQNVKKRYDWKSDTWRDMPTGPDMKNIQVTLRRAASISAILKDSSGRPVREGLLLVNSIGKGGVWKGFVTDVQLPVLTGKTNAEGKAVVHGLPEGTVVGVTASGQGYAYETRMDTIRSGTENIPFTLVPEGRIEGRVTDAVTGKPVEGIRVHVVGPGNWFQGGRETTTDRDGRYSIRKTRPGTYFLSFMGWSIFRGDLPEYAPARVDSLVLRDSQEVSGVDVRLARGGIVAGRITDAGTGEPVSGIRVYEYDGKAAVGVTDRNGVYRLRVNPGKARIYRTDPAPGAYAYDAPVPVTVMEGKTVEGVDFKLRKLIEASGKIFSPEGKPVVGANAWFTRNMLATDGKTVTVTGGGVVSMPDGAVVITGLAEGEQVTLHAEKKKAGLRGNLQYTPHSGAEAKEFVLRLERFALHDLEGRIVGEKGAPVDMAKVTFSPNHGETNSGAYSNSVGKFRLAGLEIGKSYRITITAKGYEKLERELAPFSEDMTDLKDIVLKKSQK